MLIDVQRLTDIVAGDDALENQLWRELRDLADELNGNLADYEVSLVHLDTGDYLRFVKVDPTEAAFWQDQEEQRQEIERAMMEGAIDDLESDA